METIAPISTRLIEDGEVKSNLKAVCLGCGEKVREEDSLYPWNKKKSPSTALCDRCFLLMCIFNISTIWRNQKKQGFFDCFGKALNGYCDQKLCKYHDLCIPLSLFIIKNKIDISSSRPVFNDSPPSIQKIIETASRSAPP
jgi:hypothetical protein